MGRVVTPVIYSVPKLRYPEKQPASGTLEDCGTIMPFAPLHQFAFCYDLRPGGTAEMKSNRKAWNKSHKTRQSKDNSSKYQKAVDKRLSCPLGIHKPKSA